MQPARRDISPHRVYLRAAKIGQQEKILPHQLVRDAHQLAVHLAGRLVDPDRVIKRLRHLLHAVQALENRRHQHDLRFLPVVALQLAPAQQVEFLIRPAQLHIALERHRVVALHHRIQQLVQADWLLRLEALVKLVALQHLASR